MSTEVVDLRKYKKVIFFTGAGASAESGIPTFRGKGGVWEKYDYKRYACQTAFDRDPELVWEFNNKRREVVAGCDPNDGHKFIAQLEKELPGNIEEVIVITQNIDGLHQRAGSKRIYELHGSLWKVRHDPTGEVIENHDVPMDAKRPDGAYWRPDIVWFGDNLPDYIEEAMHHTKTCDIFISIGTSGVVWPAAGFPLAAKKQGAYTIEINPQETELSPYFDKCMRGPSSVMLPLLLPGASSVVEQFRQKFPR